MVCPAYSSDDEPPDCTCDVDDQLMKDHFVFFPRDGAQHLGGRRFGLATPLDPANTDRVRVAFRLPYRVMFFLTGLKVEYTTDDGTYTKTSRVVLFDPSTNDPVVDDYGDETDEKTYEEDDLLCISGDKLVVQLRCPGAAARGGTCQFRIQKMDACVSPATATGG